MDSLHCLCSVLFCCDKVILKHADELLSLMSAMMGDNGFKEIANEIAEKENINMCEVLDRIREKGRPKGI